MKPARFHDIRDKVLAGVDRVFAEPVRLTFFEDKKTDPSRPQLEIEAVLRTGGGTVSNVSGGQSQSWRTRITAQKAELHINRATYTGPTIRQGDIVRALSRPAEPRFEVLHVDDRGHSRLVIELGEA